MDDGFQFREGKGIKRRLHNLFLTVLLRILLVYGTHHLKSNDCGAVFADNNILNVVRIVLAVHKHGSKTLSCNIDGIDDSLITAGNMLKAQCLKIHILLGGQNSQKSLVEKRVNMTANLICDQFLYLLNTRAEAYAKHLPFLAENKDIRT